MKIRPFPVLVVISAMLFSCELLDEDQAVDQEDFNTDQYFYTGHGNGKVMKVNPIEEEIWSEEVSDGIIRALTKNHNGNIIVGTLNGVVHKLDDDGNHIWEYHEQDEHITDVVVDLENNTYVLSDSGLHKINPEGEYVWSYDSAVNNAIGLTLFQDEYLLLASGSSVHKLNFSGDRIWSYDDPSDEISYITVDQEENIFVSTFGDGIHQIDENGARIRTLLSDSWVRSVAIDAAQNIFVGKEYDDENGGHSSEFIKLRENGSRVWSEQMGVGEIQQIHIDDEGFIYPVVPVINEIRAFNRNSELIWSYSVDELIYSLYLD